MENFLNNKKAVYSGKPLNIRFFSFILADSIVKIIRIIFHISRCDIICGQSFLKFRTLFAR